MKNDPVIAALAALDTITPHTTEGRKQLTRALASKWNLVTAKAARIAGEAEWSELKPELAAAFERLRRRGSELDKGCAAMIAIARTLYRLDFDSHELFLQGIRHVQMEPVWGGSVDTAAELRAVSAVGLANTRYPGTLRELVQLLVDKEWQARIGAVHALAAAGSDTAALLLRLKTLSGDAEPEVMHECFSGLLAIEGAEALPLVTSYAGPRDRDAAVREAALLALGSSRRVDAVAWLQEYFSSTRDVQIQKFILLSLATARIDVAIDFLVSLVADGSQKISDLAVSAMEIHRADELIVKRIEDALRMRKNI